MYNIENQLFDNFDLTILSQNGYMHPYNSSIFTIIKVFFNVLFFYLLSKLFRKFKLSMKNFGTLDNIVTFDYTFSGLNNLLANDNRKQKAFK